MHRNLLLFPSMRKLRKARSDFLLSCPTAVFFPLFLGNVRQKDTRAFIRRFRARGSLKWWLSLKKKHPYPLHYSLPHHSVPLSIGTTTPYAHPFLWAWIVETTVKPTRLAGSNPNCEKLSNSCGRRGLAYILKYFCGIRTSSSLSSLPCCCF